MKSRPARQSSKTPCPRGILQTLCLAMGLLWSTPGQTTDPISPALSQYLATRCEGPAAELRPTILMHFPSAQVLLARELCSEIHSRINESDIHPSSRLHCSTGSDSDLAFSVQISSPCRFGLIVDATNAAQPAIIWNSRQGLEAGQERLPPLPAPHASSSEKAAWSTHLSKQLRARHPDHVRAIQESLLKASGGPKDWETAEAERPELRHWLRMLLEISSALGAGSAYYYTHQEWASADWDLTREDFWRKAALQPGTLSLDTNDLYVNGISHPLAGMTYYLAARTNRFSPLESVAISFISSYLWEVLIENRELTSLNDLYFTPFAGAVLGEAVYALGEFLNCRFAARNTVSSCANVAQRMDVSAGMRTGLEIDEMGHPGFRSDIHVGSEADRRPIERADSPTVLLPGDWNQLSLIVGAIHDGTSRGSLTLEVQSLLVAIQGMILPGRDTGHKSIFRIDLHSGFVFKDSPMGSQQDRQAILEVLGARARILIPVGNLRLELHASLSGNLMIIESWAFAPWVQAQPAPGRALSRADSTLRIRGFSHLWGLSTQAGLRVRDLEEVWRIDFSILERTGWKMEGADRFPERATAPVRGLTEQRLTVRGKADIAIPGRPLRAGVLVEHERGGSQIAETYVDSGTTRVLGTLTFEFR